MSGHPRLDMQRGGARLSDVGQATPLLIAMLVVVLATASVGFGVSRVSIALDDRQTVADLAALQGADALRVGRRPAEAERTASEVAGGNGFRAEVEVPDSGSPMPMRVRVRITGPISLAPGVEIPVSPVRMAEAMVVAPVGLGVDPGPGDYQGPFAWRQGKPMRPDVALAFDRLSSLAARAGIALSVNSAWRSTAEQARLFAAHPDPRWVAPPGRSLHRLGTELDLGPEAAYGWLAANAPAVGFAKRYSWEPWHFGYVRSPGSTSVGWGLRNSPARHGSLPNWVPRRFAAAIVGASIRHGVSAALIAAQIRAESDFNPRVVSPAGAMGISQLMPDEARRFRVDPFDPDSAIEAQARLMAELLSRFGSVPLALAAYNAGAGAVSRCGCIPPYPETRAYVARIIGWLDGAGSGPGVRLVA